jgi:hypothetical protein
MSKEVGLLKEGKAKEGQKKGNLYIEVTQDVTLTKGDRIFLNDPKDYLKFIVGSEKSSDKQRSWAEKELEAFESGDRDFIKKRLNLGNKK